MPGRQPDRGVDPLPKLTEQLLNHLPDGVIFLDAQWRFAYINRQAAKLIGKTSPEVLGKVAWDIFPEAYQTEIGHKVRAAMSTGRQQSFHSYYQPFKKWFSMQARPLNGGLAVIFRDISAQHQAELALHQSQQRLVTALAGVNGAVWEWHITSDQHWWSPEMYRLMGIKPDTPLSIERWLERIDPQDRPPMEQALSSGLAKLNHFHHEYRVQHPKLGLRWIESRGQVIHQQGQPFLMRGMSFDITTRKRQQQALLESEIRFRALFDQSAVGMSLADTQANWLTINDAYPKMFGYSRRELAALHISQLIHPDDLPSAQQTFQDLLAGQINHISEERRYIHKDGSIVYGLVQSSIIRDPDGQPKFVATVVQDITPGKVAQASLKASEERFRTLIEQSTDVIQLINAQGLVEYTGDSITQVLGYTPKELIGQGGTEFIHPDDQPRFFHVFGQLVATPGGTVSLEYRLKHKDGRWVWVEAIGANHLDNPSVRAIVGNFRDISQRKYLEQQRDDFLNIASHELRTPVTSLKGYIQVLQRRFGKRGDVDGLAMMERAEAQTNRLINLIQDLVDSGKIDGGQLLMHPQRFDLDPLVDEIVEEMRLTSLDQRFEVSGQTGRSIDSDRDRIGQVLTNLLSNAAKYSPAGQPILIKLSATTTQAKICIQDFGPGIPATQLPLIFDRFYRVGNKENESIPGMGLGLYISAEIIKRAGGKIWVKSQEGHGAQFFVTLPAAKKN